MHDPINGDPRIKTVTDRHMDRLRHADRRAAVTAGSQ
jgi:hypothetical protein